MRIRLFILHVKGIRIVCRLIVHILSYGRRNQRVGEIIRITRALASFILIPVTRNRGSGRIGVAPILDEYFTEMGVFGTQCILFRSLVGIVVRFVVRVIRVQDTGRRNPGSPFSLNGREVVGRIVTDDDILIQFFRFPVRHVQIDTDLHVLDAPVGKCVGFYGKLVSILGTCEFVLDVSRRPIRDTASLQRAREYFPLFTLIVEIIRRRGILCYVIRECVLDGRRIGPLVERLLKLSRSHIEIPQADILVVGFDNLDNGALEIVSPEDDLRGRDIEVHVLGTVHRRACGRAQTPVPVKDVKVALHLISVGQEIAAFRGNGGSNLVNLVAVQGGEGIGSCRRRVHDGNLVVLE